MCSERVCVRINKRSLNLLCVWIFPLLLVVYILCEATTFSNASSTFKYLKEKNIIRDINQVAGSSVLEQQRVTDKPLEMKPPPKSPAYTRGFGSSLPVLESDNYGS